MTVSRIFDVFSRKPQRADFKPKALTPQFRNRVIQLFVTTFPPYYQLLGSRSRSLTEYWPEFREKLLYFHGLHSLSDMPRSNPPDEVYNFILTCNDEHFLDFIELVFQSDSIHNSIDLRTGNPVDMSAPIANINKFMEVDELPYYLTDFTVGSGRTVMFPHIIRRDSEVLHDTAIKPTLTLLSNSIYVSANEEFLDALKDFRNGDYGDCVAKCGSSFESVMKIICDRNKWHYQQQDTASTLLKTILPKTQLEPFFEQPIMLIATIRNKLSTAHGAGTESRETPRHVAQYAINATASAILLLVNETNP